MDIIKIEHLTRNYGSNRGVFDLSLTIKKGEVFGFLGPNGAGKSTTIRHLMGFLKPQKGTCSINALDCWHDRSKIQQTLGYIPGEISFFDDMTGTNFLKFIKKYRGTPETNRMNELMERFDLDPNHKLKKMSKGTKQKVGIIAAFMHDPDVIILDEPTSGLDPLMQNRFIELVLDEEKRGKTILMSSHMFEEVERTCHRVAIIKDGTLVVNDSVNALRDARTKRYTITFDSNADALAFSKENLTIQSISKNRVTVVIGNDLHSLIAIMNRYFVTNISTPKQSLEELFMQYYGGDNNV